MDDIKNRIKEELDRARKTLKCLENAVRVLDYIYTYYDNVSYVITNTHFDEIDCMFKNVDSVDEVYFMKFSFLGDKVKVDFKKKDINLSRWFKIEDVFYVIDDVVNKQKFNRFFEDIRLS